MNKRQQKQIIQSHHAYLSDHSDRQAWLNACHLQRLAEQQAKHPSELQRRKYDYHKMLERDRQRYYNTQ